MHESTREKFKKELETKERLYQHYCYSGGYDALARLSLAHQIKELRHILGVS